MSKSVMGAPEPRRRKKSVDHDADRIPTVELPEDDAPPVPVSKEKQQPSIDTVVTVEQTKEKKPGKNPDTVKDFVQATLKKGVKGLVADFRSEKRGNDFTKMTAFVAQNPEGRNRYKDVGCLDNNRVELKHGPVPYIHANYVAGLQDPKKFICTQAPVNKTIADFWYMIVQEKCAYILMLCNHKEQGATKCADYFPRALSKAISHEGVTVTALTVSRHKFRFPTKIVVVRTTLEVTVPGQPPHKCTHMHWRDWPDRGVPPTDLAPVELCGWLRAFSRQSKAPIVIHCSAGIGRTGSIVLIDLLLELQRKGTKWDSDLLGYMKHLRSQRNNSVQTEHQYLYIHQVMLNYIINHQGHLPDNAELIKKYAKFEKEYQSYCKGF